MDDIERAQIGQRREVAHEIIKHPAKPKTNLPSMKAIDKQDKSYWKFNYQGFNKRKESLVGSTILLIIILLIIATKLMELW
jgi:hypothetical protein